MFSICEHAKENRTQKDINERLETCWMEVSERIVGVQEKSVQCGLVPVAQPLENWGLGNRVWGLGDDSALETPCGSWEVHRCLSRSKTMERFGKFMNHLCLAHT